jgi:hypothetical protein
VLRYTSLVLLMVTAAASVQLARAEDLDEVAKQLSNPAAPVTSIPIVFDFDHGAGPDGDGMSYTLKAQPVIPFKLNDDFNVISRTIAPLTFQTDIYPDDVFGLGDVTKSFFVTPSKPSHFVWALGPAFLLPTATDERLGSGKFGAGATALLLYGQGKISVGVLATQIWSVWGDEDRADVSLLQLQPFINYSLGDGQTLTANLESSYDWIGDQWTVPLNVSYSKVFQVDEQTLKWQIGARAYLEAPEGGPEWGLRTGLTFVVPPSE